MDLAVFCLFFHFLFLFFQLSFLLLLVVVFLLLVDKDDTVLMLITRISQAANTPETPHSRRHMKKTLKQDGKATNSIQGETAMQGLQEWKEVFLVVTLTTDLSTCLQIRWIWLPPTSRLAPGLMFTTPGDPAFWADLTSDGVQGSNDEQMSLWWLVLVHSGQPWLMIDGKPCLVIFNRRQPRFIVAKNSHEWPIIVQKYGIYFTTVNTRGQSW